VARISEDILYLIVQVILYHFRSSLASGTVVLCLAVIFIPIFVRRRTYILRKVIHMQYEEYLIYLRKSRSDASLEAMGVDVLERHEQILLDLAKRMNLSIGGIYREVVSGESISARPEMQRLLSEVEAGRWKGVVVMEVERLARGDTIDQGIVQRVFRHPDCNSGQNIQSEQ